MRKALYQRTYVVAARKNLENADVNVHYASNQKLPDLSLVAGYGSSGIRGTIIEREGFGGPVIRTTPRGFSGRRRTAFGGGVPPPAPGADFTRPPSHPGGGRERPRAPTPTP